VCCAGQLLPSVFQSNAWGILHTLLEMFSYRLHHIQPHYRIQLLSQLHQLAQVQQMTQYQLHLWYGSLVSSRTLNYRVAVWPTGSAVGFTSVKLLCIEPIQALYRLWGCNAV